MRKLMNLFRDNRGRGAGLQARATDDGGTVLEVYDVIVASDNDVEWFGGVSAEAFARAVRGFKGDELHVRVNSPGGDVFAGVAMAQAIAESPARVVVHVDGYAASAASLLVAAADEAVMAPAGMVMIHKAWTIALGNADDFRREADVLAKIDGQLAETYKRKAGGETDEWMERMAAETWYTAGEAVAAGLADRVAEPVAKAKALAFDLSAYERAPAVAPAAPTDVSAAARAIGEVAAQEMELKRRRARARAALQSA